MSRRRGFSKTGESMILAEILRQTEQILRPSRQQPNSTDSAPSQPERRDTSLAGRHASANRTPSYQAIPDSGLSLHILTPHHSGVPRLPTARPARLPLPNHRPARHTTCRYRASDATRQTPNAFHPNHLRELSHKIESYQRANDASLVHRTAPSHLPDPARWYPCAVDPLSGPVRT